MPRYFWGHHPAPTPLLAAPPGWPISARMPGRFQPEWVADFNRNARPVSTRMGGRFDPDFTLIVTEAENGFGTIQSRNPTTGALILATKPGILGVTAPTLSEVSGGGVWLSVATGMQGYLERVEVSTLRPTPLSLPYPGDASNGISAEIMAGVLYVQQIAGGPTRNYCGNPSTGQMFAGLGLGPAATVLAADSTDLFYVPVVSYVGPVARGEELVAMPINAKCRA